MEIRRLSEFVDFDPGINQTRAEKKLGQQEISYYDNQSFERDLKKIQVERKLKDYQPNFSDFAVQLGDVVINNTTQLAAIVGSTNVGRVLSLNFTKVNFNGSQLDQNYFVYLFNEYTDLQKQKAQQLQGTGTTVRITSKALEHFVIPVIPLAEQQKMGLAYTKVIELQSNLTVYGSLLEDLTKSILKKNLEGD
ncbi:MAG TPA: restriction endonuclease subunit S [Candidatus Ligilactobacillus excrementipullorum]|nr:restriction endonuclease subunit S [Candidatus Ligilactobacillus excrementipullorum]